MTTGADGRATVSFDLSDDLTSWRISADGDQQPATSARPPLVPVGLPLFVEAPLAPDYLAGERPVLRVRAYGEALKAGDRVTFTVAAPSLGMAETHGRRRGVRRPSRSRSRASGRRPRGHVEASAGSGAAAAGDRLVRTIHVVDTRFTQRRTVYADLADGLPRRPGRASSPSSSPMPAAPVSSAARVACRGDGARVDQALAAAIARDLLVATFGADPARFTSPAFDPSRYQVQPTGDDNDGDRSAASPSCPTRRPTWRSPPGSPSSPATGSTSRSCGVLHRAARRGRAEFEGAAEARGRAGTSPWPASPASASRSSTRSAPRSRTPTSRSGSGSTSRSARPRSATTPRRSRVERDLLGAYGERLGPGCACGSASSLDDTIEATALVALIGATVGDPAAEWAEAYVEENRAVDDLFNLQQVGYIARVLERTPAEAARVAYSVAGVERTVDIAAGGAFSLDAHPGAGGDLHRATGGRARRGRRLLGRPGRSGQRWPGSVAHARADGRARGPISLRPARDGDPLGDVRAAGRRRLLLGDRRAALRAGPVGDERAARGVLPRPGQAAPRRHVPRPRRDPRDVHVGAGHPPVGGLRRALP